MQPRTRMLMEQERQRRLAAGIARSQCGISHILNECIAVTLTRGVPLEDVRAEPTDDKPSALRYLAQVAESRPVRAIPKPGGKKR